MIFIVIKFGGYFLQRYPTIFFHKTDLTQLHPGQWTIFVSLFRGWFSTVPVDGYFLQHCQLLTRVCPINQKYTTCSPFSYTTLRSILWFLCSILCFCDPSRLCAIYRKETQQT
jgi:hypothetical protein